MKKIMFIFIFILHMFIVSACGKSNITNNNEVIYYNAIGKIGEDMPVTRLDAAIAISFIFDDYDTIKNMEKKAMFSDVDIESDDYIFVNYVYTKGIMVGDGEKFNPNEPLTIVQAQSLIDLVNKDNTTKIKMSDDIKDKAISHYLWNSLLFQASQNIGAIEDELKIFEVSEDNNIYYTDKGEFRYKSTSNNVFKGNTVKVFLRGNNIIGFLEVVNNSIEFNNIFIKKENENNVLITVNGVTRKFQYTIENDICGDVIISNDNIQITENKEYKDDIIKLVSENYIETESMGRLEYSENFTVYRYEGIPSEKEELLCSDGNCRVYLKEGKVSSVWFEKIEKPENIRVVISDNEKDGYIQSDIILRCAEGFTLIYGENEKQFIADEKLIIDMGNSVNYFSNNCRIYIKPNNNGKTIIESITKAKSFPEYRGIIEIEKRDNGFVIINELPFEEYLYGVVPCEMPVSFGLEALMVQAVTARSYGYNQFFTNRFYDYGANIDDTVSSQVYNNMGEYDESTEAVKSTENMFLTYDNTVISANYFSTSCGFTANSGETWADTALKEFPTETKPYLISKPQFEGNTYKSLENEQDFRSFIQSNEESYDNNSPWYRWTVEMTGTELSQAVKTNFENLFNNSPAMMEYSKDGVNFEKTMASNIGRIKNITVEKRGQGGNIMTLLLEGESGYIRVNSEYNIRKILSPKSYVATKDVIVKCHNGIEFKNLEIMPSGFFTFDYEKDNFGFINKIIFYGGGNGHGVGMSQNGVKGMAEKGYSFDEILNHYFEGSKVSIIE